MRKKDKEEELDDSEVPHFCKIDRRRCLREYIYDRYLEHFKLWNVFQEKFNSMTQNKTEEELVKTFDSLDGRFRNTRICPLPISQHQLEKNIVSSYVNAHELNTMANISEKLKHIRNNYSAAGKVDNSAQLFNFINATALVPRKKGPFDKIKEFGSQTMQNAKIAVTQVLGKWGDKNVKWAEKNPTTVLSGLATGGLWALNFISPTLASGPAGMLGMGQIAAKAGPFFNVLKALPGHA